MKCADPMFVYVVHVGVLLVTGTLVALIVRNGRRITRETKKWERGS